MVTYVLDTTVLIDDPDIIRRLGQVNVVIPTAVIRQLDGLKNSTKEGVARNARSAARFIEIYSGRVSVSPNHVPVEGLSNWADNQIVGTAVYLNRSAGSVTLLTTDRNMRTIARAYGVRAKAGIDLFGGAFFNGGSGGKMWKIKLLAKIVALGSVFVGIAAAVVALYFMLGFYTATAFLSIVIMVVVRGGANNDLALNPAFSNFGFNIYHKDKA